LRDPAKVCAVCKLNHVYSCGWVGFLGGFGCWWSARLAGKLHVPRPRRATTAHLLEEACWPVHLCVCVVKLSFVCLPTWKTLGFVKFMQMSFRQLAINVCTSHSIYVCVCIWAVAICGPFEIQIMRSTFTAGHQLPLTWPKRPPGNGQNH